ncbi:hypothetical protein GCM10022254_55840 [Actinomadura meridiana]|uniref:HTH cro/C1-type domain-containing protein n=1 Tax=Actinomadura meridiana TaxID=559626 RepID=A0ABP8CFN4_9ACTN
MSKQSEPPALQLYNRLKAIQLDRGWSNKQLAARAEISRNTIENWKTQPRSPRPGTVKAVASRLGIPYAEALRLAGIITSEDSPVSQRLAACVVEHDERTGHPTERANGIVSVTLEVNFKAPEPDGPPGGLRTQSEQIIWAMSEDPWPTRLARILVGRKLEETIADDEEGTE